MVRDAVSCEPVSTLFSLFGSGSTLIAAETCGRTARLIEYEPGYCDVIIQRYEQFTGKAAILMTTEQTFEEVAAERETSVERGAA